MAAPPQFMADGAAPAPAMNGFALLFVDGMFGDVPKPVAVPTPPPPWKPIVDDT